MSAPIKTLPRFLCPPTPTPIHATKRDVRFHSLAQASRQAPTGMRHHDKRAAAAADPLAAPVLDEVNKRASPNLAAADDRADAVAALPSPTT